MGRPAGRMELFGASAQPGTAIPAAIPANIKRRDIRWFFSIVKF
jgi:hypothetical protein